MLSLAQSLTLSDFHQMYAIERAYYDPVILPRPRKRSAGIKPIPCPPWR